jgi:hypothetical protein
VTDRELLEAAAKAEGHTVELDERSGLVYYGDRFSGLLWNPLYNDGDALRLAITKKLKITIGNAIVMVESRWPLPDVGERFDDEAGASAATRRAIVRAAAAMAG